MSDISAVVEKTKLSLERDSGLARYAGSRPLGFNVDHNFSDALDGLILVDLTRSDDRMLTRLMGKESASRFLEFSRPPGLARELMHGAPETMD